MSTARAPAGSQLTGDTPTLTTRSAGVLTTAPPERCRALLEMLRSLGWRTTVLRDGRDDVPATPPLEVAILDLRNPTPDAARWLNRAHRASPSLQVVFLGDATPTPGVGVIEFDQTVAFGWLRTAWHIDDLDELATRLVPHVAQDLTDQDLRDGLADPHQIHLQYQPVFDIRGSLPTICRAEALVRWRHPQLGLLAADSVLTAFAAAGHHSELFRWVVHAAVAQAARWRHLDIPIAINVDASVLVDPTVTDTLTRALAAADVARDRLALEIAEDGVGDRGEQVLASIRALADAGSPLILDNFGRHAVSFRHTLACPFRGMTLDPLLTQGVTRDDRVRQLVRGATQLGHSLGCTVGVKSIADAETLAFLKGLGCDEAQGWHLGGPVSADASSALKAY